MQENDTIASRLRSAYSGGAIRTLREVITSQDQAYAIQEINTRLWIDEKRSLVGRKIGLTAPTVQQQLGVDEPDFGMLFDDMRVEDAGSVALARLIQPRIEAEIAFVMSDELSMPEPTTHDVIAATDYVVPALEIVDSRIRDWNINICDTIADNASSAYFVLGDQQTPLGDVDVEAVSMSLSRDGELVGKGRGSDCLGSPLNSVLWLARKLVSVRRPLAPGDIVLSGALGKMVSVAAPARFEANLSALGSVSVHFDGN